MNNGFLAIIMTALLPMAHAEAERKDSLKHFGAEIDVNPGHVIKMDKYQEKWMKRNDNYSAGIKLNYMTLPSDSDAYAVDFGYPTFGLGIKYCYNNKVTMHRDEDPIWRKLQTVDYDSHLGNTITVYGSFVRPFLRSSRWELNYTLDFGVGYSHHKYNTYDAIDNELIGSHWLIYFGAGLNAVYRFARDWGLGGGDNFLSSQQRGAEPSQQRLEFCRPVAGFMPLSLL